MEATSQQNQDTASFNSLAPMLDWNRNEHLHYLCAVYTAGQLQLALGVAKAAVGDHVLVPTRTV